jgi:hypothetical protein
MAFSNNGFNFLLSGFSAHSRLPPPRRRSHFPEEFDQQMSSSIFPNCRRAAASPAHAVHATQAHGKVESGISLKSSFRYQIFEAYSNI